MRSKILEVICLLVLCGVLVCGLWPFHAPRNEVRWLSNGNGLLFGDYGSLLSAGGFQTRSSSGGACLEIWLEPSVINDWGTILSVYPPQGRSTSFSLRQSWDDLALQRKDVDEKRSTRSARIYAARVFRYGKPVFLTITSGEQGTSIYVDGALVRVSREFRLSNEDLTGQLVIGNSSVTTDTWSGQLKGLAIYDRELTPSQVTQHYQDWLGNEHPYVFASGRAVALCLFDEGSGDVVHNQVNSATDLIIPNISSFCMNHSSNAPGMSTIPAGTTGRMSASILLGSFRWDSFSTYISHECEESSVPQLLRSLLDSRSV